MKTFGMAWPAMISLLPTCSHAVMRLTIAAAIDAGVMRASLATARPLPRTRAGICYHCVAMMGVGLHAA